MIFATPKAHSLLAVERQKRSPRATRSALEHDSAWKVMLNQSISSNALAPSEPPLFQVGKPSLAPLHFCQDDRDLLQAREGRAASRQT
jgi:hypothetical protein